MGRNIDHHLPFVGLNKISLAFNNLAIARADLNYGRSSVDIKNFLKEGNDLQWGEL